VLADTTYGRSAAFSAAQIAQAIADRRRTSFRSCCVDEVAAQHVDADLIVHYGHTCLSPYVYGCRSLLRGARSSRLAHHSTARLPVIYVLTKRPIDPEHAASSLASTSKDSLDNVNAVLLMYDVGYAHKAGKASLDSSPSFNRSCLFFYRARAQDSRSSDDSSRGLEPRRPPSEPQQEGQSARGGGAVDRSSHCRGGVDSRASRYYTRRRRFRPRTCAYARRPRPFVDSTLQACTPKSRFLPPRRRRH